MCQSTAFAAVDQEYSPIPQRDLISFAKPNVLARSYIGDVSRNSSL